MLRWRLLLGTAIIAVLVGLCWLDWRAEQPGVVLLPLAVALSLAAVGELLAMFRKQGHEPLAWAVYGGTLVSVLAAAAPLFAQPMPTDTIVGRLGWLAIGLVVAAVLVVVCEMQRYDGSRQSTVNLSLAVFAILYCGGLIGFLMQLRMIGAEDGRWGMVALVSLVATVKMSDVGQYTAGRLFGRHKLAPQLSPGKTWEGVVGGFIFACAAAWFVLHWCAPRMVDAVVSPSLLHTMVYAAALAAAGIVGDLFESMLKRDAGVKDSSGWLPGFGGVLDLLDSLLVAAPVAYLFWALRIVGP
jgi:phosphatidate cytidylyltransferase